MLADSPGEDIVHFARPRNAFSAIDQVSAGPRGGKHLYGNAGLIHFSQASGPEIRQLLVGSPPAANRKAPSHNSLPVDFPDRRGDGEMFLQCDDAHGYSP